MTHLKLQKLQKADYPPAHRLNVNVLLSNITFFNFCSFRCVIRRQLVSKPRFFTFMFAVLLHFCSCYVVQGTWYGVRDTHNF